MNPENTQTTSTIPVPGVQKPLSFFDDDDLNFVFNFSIPQIHHNKALSFPFTVKSNLFLKTNNAGDRLFALHGNLIVQYDKESESTPRFVLPVSHSKLRYIKPSYEGCDYGFTVSRNGNTMEFYCQDKLVIDNWFDALKGHCVLQTFHDDYKAIKMIGRGSFAKVYLVESKVNGKSFAVKAFTKDSMNVSNKANAKPSMLNEIDIMRAVDHENVIKLHEVYETDKSIYLVLELIQGRSLYDYLKKGSFKAEEGYPIKMINITRSLLDAISYLASKGIMHRDLKPDNILLDKGDKVKIVDFGLATFIDLDVYIFKKCGTPGYIAPEVFKYDEKDRNTFYNDKSDVFSVGCLLYFMLYGTPMFEAPTAPEILKKNRNFTATSPLFDSLRKELNDPAGKIPKDGINLMLDLLEFEQHKRISACEALSHPYFIPVPTGMQRVFGTNEFIIEGLSRHIQTDEYSPCSPVKVHTKPSYEVFSPLTPLRIDLMETQSPLFPPQQDRFVKGEESMYLDMGKPDITGRTDTITNGSMNNSLMFINRGDSNCASPCFKSAFGGRNSSRTATKQYKGNSGQSFLKAAIFRNMQRNNSESTNNEEYSEVFSPKVTLNRGFSSPVGTDSTSPGKKLYECAEVVEQAGQEGEEEGTIGQIHLNFSGNKLENGEITGHGKTTSGESSLGKTRRFQPFAKGNLIIPKNTAGMYQY